MPSKKKTKSPQADPVNSQSSTKINSRVSDFAIKHVNYVSVREHPQKSKVYYELEKGKITKADSGEFLVIGFDTEYKPLNKAVDADDILLKLARYEVLSYQFFAKSQQGDEWSGLILPDKGKRIPLQEFIVYTFAKGIADQKIKAIPSIIYLVAHYNRADVPAFEERNEFIKRLSNIRNSLISKDLPIKLQISFVTDQSLNSGVKANLASSPDIEEVSIYIRDTILLSPSGSKSLAEIGKLVDCPKISLSKKRIEERRLKENMDILLQNNWDLFYEYALNDAKICALYFLRIVNLYQTLMQDNRVPTALSSIGVSLLRHGWKTRKPPISHLEVRGKEEIRTQSWNDETQKYSTKKEEIYKEKANWFIDFVTECYHGGRNEQFWFGPSFEDAWSDYDLTGAYPTAMAAIGTPKWDELHYSDNVNDYTPDTLGFACVKFEFDGSVRYPTMPIRTANGIIFPLKGKSYCSSPEIKLALDLGAKLKIEHGIIIPWDLEDRPFFDFLKHSIDQRRSAKTKIEEKFWKEITTSTYGKTAQGLRKKRTFNLSTEDNRQLSESRITNPYYAAYITSFVRAVTGEIMNGIPKDKMVFSVTTDGFITNASEQEIKSAQSGPVCNLFGLTRKMLTGKHEILTEKHFVKRLLGWKTRGQSTLVAGNKKNIPNHILAKSGIQSPFYSESIEDQNEDITKLFFDREGDTKYELNTNTTLRDMVLRHADLVRKKSERRLNMEYDFKRRPYSVIDAEINYMGNRKHLVFSTVPWRTVNEFTTLRSLFDSFIIDKDNRCLKSVDAYSKFAQIFDIKIPLKASDQKYLSKEGDTDLKRFRRDLCRAFKHGHAGFEHYSASYTAKQFASLLLQSGFSTHNIEVKMSDVQNAKRYPFAPNATPRSEAVMNIASEIKLKMPLFNENEILAVSDDEVTLQSAINRYCLFTSKLLK